jgi:hypothetical protein
MIINDFLVRYQVLSEASMKVAFLCNLVSCSLLDSNIRFRGAYCRNVQGDDYCSVDGDRKHLWILGQFLPEYTAKYLRRQTSSFSSLISVSSKFASSLSYYFSSSFIPPTMMEISAKI